MTSELSDFAARLRASIRLEGRAAQGPDSVPSIDDMDYTKSSFRKDAIFNSLALELFALQFTHNLAYRKICEARRVSPQSVSHWSQIPAVPTTAFKELELTCLPLAQRTHVFHSSGTTEQRPSRHFHTEQSLAVYEASLLVWFRIHIPNCRKLLLLTPPPAQAPHSSLVHMFETVRREFGAPETTFVGAMTRDGLWALNFDPAKQILLEACRETNPVVLLGTAFSFVHLLDFLTDQGLRLQLPPGSRVMETGGYKGRSRSLLKAELHACITERLGIPRSQIFCEYGMCELSSQAYDGVAGGYAPVAHHAIRIFRFPPWSRAQVVSPETGREVREGETGLIRVLDLANVFATMAIQTEDLGIRRGDGFELIGRAKLAEPRGCSLTTA